MHRLAGEGCDVLWSAAQDFVFDGARGTQAELFRVLAGEGVAIPVRVHHVTEAFVNRIAVLVHVAHAAHRARGDRRAVIGILAADDDAPFRLALQHPVMADEADRGIVRFRSGGTEENLIEVSGRQFGELARKLDDGRMRRLEERIVERQFHDLVVGGLREFLVAVADVRRPKACHAVEDAIALAIDDVSAFTFHNDARAGGGAQRLVRREGMQVVL